MVTERVNGLTPSKLATILAFLDQARTRTPWRATGTLSPLDSFAGELGIDFPHRLEAPHVINVRKQCLVTSIGYFSGVSLDARYLRKIE